MKAVIKLDVPKWQIGQEVSVHFPDTAVKKAICEKDSDIIIDEIEYIEEKFDEIAIFKLIQEMISSVCEYTQLLNIYIEKIVEIVDIQQKEIEELQCDRYEDK